MSLARNCHRANVNGPCDRTDFLVIGALWAVFAATEQPPRIGANPKAAPAKVTNVDVMAGGAQVTPLDQWIGDAGKKMALYERDKQEQEKRNKDNATFQEQVLKRFSAVDEQLRAQSSAAAQNAPVPAVPAPQTSLPPASALSNTGQLPPPPPPGGATAGLPAGLPPAPMADAARASPRPCHRERAKQTGSAGCQPCYIRGQAARR